MEDKQIVELFWARNEQALAETHKKYNYYCRTIAFNILNSNEDSEECVNDTYVRAWNSIPPTRPKWLSVFLGRITRNLALDRSKARKTQKRGNGRAEIVLDEITECINANPQIDVSDDIALRDALNSFLYSLSKETRMVFLKKYWYMYSVSEIADELSITESKVKILLHRTRNSLREYLEKEGISI
ncbi:MAG: RNA polymerase sigma factor [Clostridia bacterium]|nr:RNA polymerase sigma factor [Clostridia bacterium]